MKYSVKLVIRHAVETGGVFLEESILMLEADSFDDAYAKAERYVAESGMCFEYDNVFGKRVRSEVASWADCFSVCAFDDEDAVEVYSCIRKTGKGLPEDTVISVLESAASREEMLPLRQWADSDRPDELDVDGQQG